MNLIENKTKFTHLSMPSWGVGIFRKSEGGYITVEFENAGIKKFSISSINTMLKSSEPFHRNSNSAHFYFLCSGQRTKRFSHPNDENRSVLSKKRNRSF
jgi:hypothetical protein